MPIYNINIAIYQTIEKDNNLKYIHMFSYEDDVFSQPLLILQNENFNHFNIVYDIEEYNDEKNLFELTQELNKKKKL